MEEFVRRMIHEKRKKTENRPKPSETFARHFGERHGVELPVRHPAGHRHLTFPTEDG